MLDPNFPSQLLYSGHENTVEFIRLLIENYSERKLTKDTDKCVAMSALHTRIARTIGCDGRYGTLETYLHRNLLWHVCDRKLKKIEHESYVPSWSWMAYHGGIRFQDEEELPVGIAHWITSLRLDKGRDSNHALIADVGVFTHCKMKLDGLLWEAQRTVMTTTYYLFDPPLWTASIRGLGWGRYQRTAS
jgi:hypothetical protein